MRILFSGAIAALGLLVSGAALAQDAQVSESPSLSVAVPVPPFVADGATPYSQSGVSPQGNPTVINELIPAGESFEAWTTLFATMIEENLPYTLDEYLSIQYGVYRNACGTPPDAMVFLEKTDSEALYLIPCPKYNDNPTKGEVAVFFIYKTGDDFIKVYRHWRGDAFPLGDAAGWPATRAEIDSFLREVPNIRITRKTP